MVSEWRDSALRRKGATTRRTTMNLITRSIAFTLVGVSSFALLGCESKTEGERTLDKAQTIESAGNMIKRGETMVANGKAQITRGETIRDQGNRVEGERIISEGRATQKQGQALIEEGRRMKK
jgi:hypothetical protein